MTSYTRNQTKLDGGKGRSAAGKKIGRHPVNVQIMRENMTKVWDYLWTVPNLIFELSNEV